MFDIHLVVLLRILFITVLHFLYYYLHNCVFVTYFANLKTYLEKVLLYFICQK